MLCIQYRDSAQPDFFLTGLLAMGDYCALDGKLDLPALTDIFPDFPPKQFQVFLSLSSDTRASIDNLPQVSIPVGSSAMTATKDDAVLAWFRTIMQSQHALTKSGAFATQRPGNRLADESQVVGGRERFFCFQYFFFAQDLNSLADMTVEVSIGFVEFSLLSAVAVSQISLRDGFQVSSSALKICLVDVSLYHRCVHLHKLPRINAKKL